MPTLRSHTPFALAVFIIGLCANASAQPSTPNVRLVPTRVPSFSNPSAERIAATNAAAEGVDDLRKFVERAAEASTSSPRDKAVLDAVRNIHQSRRTAFVFNETWMVGEFFVHSTATRVVAGKNLDEAIDNLIAPAEVSLSSKTPARISGGYSVNAYEVRPGMPPQFYASGWLTTRVQNRNAQLTALVARGLTIDDARKYQQSQLGAVCKAENPSGGRAPDVSDVRVEARRPQGGRTVDKGEGRQGAEGRDRRANADSIGDKGAQAKGAETGGSGAVSVGGDDGGIGSLETRGADGTVQDLGGFDDNDSNPDDGGETMNEGGDE